MSIKNVCAVTALGMSLSFSCAAASAQATSASIAQRKVNQQERIGNGVKSGQLTAHETANLERREGSINREEHNMRRADDGHLTAGDKAALTNRQNNVSKSIYKDKHNSAVR
jgi:Ni/Co efflux regulator RcnB